MSEPGGGSGGSSGASVQCRHCWHCRGLAVSPSPEWRCPLPGCWPTEQPVAGTLCGGGGPAPLPALLWGSNAPHSHCDKNQGSGGGGERLNKKMRICRERHRSASWEQGCARGEERGGGRAGLSWCRALAVPSAGFGDVHVISEHPSRCSRARWELGSAGPALHRLSQPGFPLRPKGSEKERGWCELWT